jgi:arylsulfotransferase ASST
MTSSGGGNRNAGARARFDISKVVFYTLLTVSLLGLSFAIGLHAGANKTGVYLLVSGLKSAVLDSLKAVAEEAPTLEGTHPTHFLQPRRLAGAGVTVNSATTNQQDLLLLSGFFVDTNEIRLVRRTGDVVARWPVKFYTIFPHPTHMPADAVPATNWNIDTHGALALPDGSIVFNFEWGGLVKLDHCGHVVWTVARQTHHSVERAEVGGFWVPGRRMVTGDSPYPPFETPIKEDTILKISDDGQVQAEFSVPKILYDNGLAPVLTATGSWFWTGMPWDREIVHLNKVDELSSDIAGDFPMFEAGDLALSLRDHNLLLVVDPHATKIKWWKIGPWVRQHDPRFKRGGTILVFNNNIFETAFGPNHADLISPVSGPRVSNIVEIDPVSGEHKVVYGTKKGQELLSVIRGKVETTRNGGLLITEFEGGRVLETDADGNVVWEYINRYSPEEVAEISEARIYPSSYFTVNDWSCTQADE